MRNRRPRHQAARLRPRYRADALAARRADRRRLVLLLSRRRRELRVRRADAFLRAGRDHSAAGGHRRIRLLTRWPARQPRPPRPGGPRSRTGAGAKAANIQERRAMTALSISTTTWWGTATPDTARGGACCPDPSGQQAPRLPHVCPGPFSGLPRSRPAQSGAPGGARSSAGQSKATTATASPTVSAANRRVLHPSVANPACQPCAQGVREQTGRTRRARHALCPRPAGHYVGRQAARTPSAGRRPATPATGDAGAACPVETGRYRVSSFSRTSAPFEAPPAPRTIRLMPAARGR